MLTVFTTTALLSETFCIMPIYTTGIMIKKCRAKRSNQIFRQREQPVESVRCCRCTHGTQAAVGAPFEASVGRPSSNNRLWEYVPRVSKPHDDGVFSSPRTAITGKDCTSTRTSEHCAVQNTGGYCWELDHLPTSKDFSSLTTPQIALRLTVFLAPAILCLFESFGLCVAFLKSQQPSPHVS